jgi:hypothetical protein
MDVPAPLRLAVAVQVVEAAGMLVATGFSAVATANGKSYRASSGAALTLLALLAVLAIAVCVYGTAKAKPWSRTPALMIQLFAVIGGIMLVQGHRLDWGVPALILAAAATAGLLAPASLKTLNRPELDQPDQPATKPPVTKAPVTKAPATKAPATKSTKKPTSAATRSSNPPRPKAANRKA